jgi:hypothetical protein
VLQDEQEQVYGLEDGVVDDGLEDAPEGSGFVRR